MDNSGSNRRRRSIRGIWRGEGRREHDEREEEKRTPIYNAYSHDAFCELTF